MHNIIYKKGSFIMTQKKDLPGLVTGLVAILAVACFFILGFTLGSWHIIWLVFLAIPVTGIIMDFATKKKDIGGNIVGFVAILASIAYIIIGFSLEKWHPGWLVFLAIPLTAIITDIIFKRKDITGAIVGAVAVLSTVAFLLMGFFLYNWYIAWVVFLLIPFTAILVNIFKKPDTKQADKETKEE